MVSVSHKGCVSMAHTTEVEYTVRPRAAARFRSCKRARGQRQRIGASAQKEAPDWDAERLVLRKRTLKPNQLETLRKFEEEVAVGTVIHCEGGVALVEGLNSDALPGTYVLFVNHARGILLWRRGDGICLTLLVGTDEVRIGESAICQVRAILQVADADEGPKTKRTYNVAKVPDGSTLVGQIVDHMGRPFEAPARQDSLTDWPLFRPQSDIQSQEDVHESLYTGVKAVDVLTPLGRGQSLLVVGQPGSGKSSLAIDAILGQRDTGVRCIYAATAHSPGQVDELASTLQRKGAMAHATVITASPGSSTAEQFVAICTALAVAERVRSMGDHALVILDDVTCMVELWEQCSAAIGRAAAAKGPQGPGGSAPSADDKVDYEGTLISAAAAEGRRFFANVLQRSGKSHRKHGGGSLTLLAVVPGMPSAGQPQPKLTKIAQYKTLSPTQKEKLLAALQKQQQQQQQLRPQPGALPLQAPPHTLSTEIVEELMSIADGQVVLERDGEGASAVGVDARLSISRIGSKAYPPALVTLAPSIRLQLAQAVDAARFSGQGETQQQQQGFLSQFNAALCQLAGHPVPLEELVRFLPLLRVAVLVALQHGAFDGLASEVLQMRLRIYVHFLRRTHSQTLRTIAATQSLIESDALVLAEAYRVVCQKFEWD